MDKMLHLSKRHRVADWIKNRQTKPVYMLFTRDSLQAEGTDSKWGDENIYLLQMEMKKAEVAIFIRQNKL